MTIDTFLVGLSAPMVYLVVAAVVASASVAPLGWFAPSQTFALSSGVLASLGVISPPGAVASVFIGSTVGCLVGYLLGSWIPNSASNMESRVGRWWAYTSDVLRARPRATVMLGRWNAALRACVPNAAGAARMGLRRFVIWNSLACALWSLAVVGVGIALHRATLGGTGLLALASLGVLSFVSIWLLRGYKAWLMARITADADLGGARVDEEDSAPPSA